MLQEINDTNRKIKLRERNLVVFSNQKFKYSFNFIKTEFPIVKKINRYYRDSFVQKLIEIAFCDPFVYSFYGWHSQWLQQIGKNASRLLQQGTRIGRHQKWKFAQCQNRIKMLPNSIWIHKNSRVSKVSTSNAQADLVQHNAIF